MPLTDTALRNIKPREKSFRIFDGGGLYLEVAPSGGKWWRFKYRFEGKEKRLSFGVYPDVGLKNVREKHTEARKQLANGIDPSENRKAVKTARSNQLGNSFEVIAREWFAKYSPTWDELYASRLLGRLEKNVFPFIGAVPITDLKAPQLLAMIRRIEGRGAMEVAYRALQYCGQIFSLRHCHQSGRV